MFNLFLIRIGFMHKVGGFEERMTIFWSVFCTFPQYSQMLELIQYIYLTAMLEPFLAA